MDGILNIYKEKGFTSHDVVAKLRGILKTRKIGHTGTLDPDATGVLPVCIGRATKLCDMLTDKNKDYEAVIRFGLTTDTEDISGNVIKTREYNGTKEEIRDTILSFKGDIYQIPPMYSAIKVNGHKLYELARKGIEIDREARKCTIYDIDIISISDDLTRARIRTKVSKGTYIRTLCNDIGEKLGCGACMEELTRTRSGTFEINDALTLKQVEDIVHSEEDILKYLVSIEDVFSLPCYKINEEYEKRLFNGNELEKNMIAVYDKQCPKGFLHTGEKDICLYFPDGRFAAIYRKTNEGHYKVYKMFC